MVTLLVDSNLQLTSKQVNGRFESTRCVALYTAVWYTPLELCYFLCSTTFLLTLDVDDDDDDDDTRDRLIT